MNLFEKKNGDNRLNQLKSFIIGIDQQKGLKWSWKLLKFYNLFEQELNSLKLNEN